MLPHRGGALPLQGLTQPRRDASLSLQVGALQIAAGVAAAACAVASLLRRSRSGDEAVVTEEAVTVGSDGGHEVLEAAADEDPATPEPESPPNITQHQVAGALEVLSDGSTPFQRDDSGLRFTLPQGWLGLEEGLQERPDGQGACWVARFMQPDVVASMALECDIPTLTVVVEDTACDVVEFAAHSREDAEVMMGDAFSIDFLRDDDVSRGIFTRELTWLQQSCNTDQIKLLFCNLMAVRVLDGLSVAYTVQLMAPTHLFDSCAKSLWALVESAAFFQPKRRRGVVSVRGRLGPSAAVAVEIPSGMMPVTIGSKDDEVEEATVAVVERLSRLIPGRSAPALLFAPTDGSSVDLLGVWAADTAAVAGLRTGGQESLVHAGKTMEDDCECDTFAALVGDVGATCCVARRRALPGVAPPCTAAVWRVSSRDAEGEGRAVAEHQRAVALACAKSGHILRQCGGSGVEYRFVHRHEGFSFSCDLQDGVVEEKHFGAARARYYVQRGRSYPELQVNVSGPREGLLEDWAGEMLDGAESAGLPVLWCEDTTIDDIPAVQLALRTPSDCPDEDGAELVLFATLVKGHSRAYMLRWVCEFEEYDRHRGTMEAVISSFGFDSPSNDSD